MNKITLASCDSGDWEGLYINSKLKYANHSLSAFDVLKCLELEFEELNFSDTNMETYGYNFPINEPTPQELSN